MARSYTKYIQVLGGGCNDYTTSELIADDEMQTSSRNIRTDANGSRLRNGYTTLLGTALTGSLSGIRAIGAYLRNVVANDRLVFIYNKKLYKIDPLTETSPTEIVQAVITSDTNIKFLTMWDNLFILNGVDKPIRVANTTVTQDFTPPDDLTAATFLPEFGEIVDNSMWVAGVPSKPNVLYVSRASTAANPEYLYDFSGAFSGYGDAIATPFPSKITAIRKIPSGIFVFCEDSVHYTPGFQDFSGSLALPFSTVNGASGCVSDKACVSVINDIYYYTPQKEIRSIQRSQSNALNIGTLPISLKIQRFLQNNISNTITDIFGVYNDTISLYKLYFTLSGQTKNSMCVVGDTNKIDNQGAPAWGFDDNMSFRCGFLYKGQMYLGSHTIGQIYKDEIGLADDDSVNIHGKLVSKEYMPRGVAEYNKFIGVRIIGECTNSTVGSTTIYIDNNSAVTGRISNNNWVVTNPTEIGAVGDESIGDFVIGDGTESDSDGITIDQKFEFIKYIPFRKSGRKIRIETETDGINNDLIIKAYELIYMPRTGRFRPIAEKQ